MSTATMPVNDDASSWVRQLESPDPLVKEKAARMLHRLGAAICLPVVDQWRQDAEFRELVRLPDASAGDKGRVEKARIVVGIAVQPDHFEKIRSANGSPRLADVPADQDAREFELHFPAGAQLDILTTRDRAAAGAIARFLEKFGDGIQQVEIYVRDVDRATEILKEKFGLTPIYPATRPGADGTRVNFFLATTPQQKKVLIELVQEELPAS
jgi:hypothetical protein